MNAEISFKLYELFIPIVKKESKAKEIVSSIEAIIDNKFTNAKDVLTTKEDLAREIGAVKTEIASVQSTLIKWMFVMFLPFYIGMIVFLIKQFL